MLSKKLIGGDGCANACPAIPMDNIDLFSIITLLSFALTLPAAVILEGVSFFFVLYLFAHTNFVFIQQVRFTPGAIAAYAAQSGGALTRR